MKAVLIGRDAPLWLAYLSLARAGVEAEAIELPSGLRPDQPYLVAPSHGGLHALAGVDHRALLQATNHAASGGTRFVGWSDSSFLLGHDERPPALDGLEITQHWAVERLAGATVSRDRLSPAAVAMARGRTGSVFGHHLDASTYSSALRSLVRGRIAATAAVVPRFDSGLLAAVELDDGRSIGGDLFVDASGPDAVLARACPGDRWESWGEAIPTRTVRYETAPALRPLPPFAELSRTDAGWIARVPFADRTAIIVGETDGDGPAFEAGLRTAWQGNVVAIGEAACCLEPLDQWSLHMAHVGIANLLAWFPTGMAMDAVRETYNRQVGRTALALLDFQSARYRQRMSEPLRQRVALFEAIGAVPALDDDPVPTAYWCQYLAGLGIRPRSAMARALAFPAEFRHQGLARLVAEIDRQVAE